MTVYLLYVPKHNGYFAGIDAEDQSISINSDPDHAALFATWEDARRSQLWLISELEWAMVSIHPFDLVTGEENGQCHSF